MSHRKIKDLIDIRNRVALITGGAGHVGSVMAEALAEVGAKIVLLDNNERACKAKAAQIQKKYKTHVLPLALDLTDIKAVKAVPRMIRKKFGRLDILVNCAALVGTSKLKGWAVPFEKQDLGTWEKAMEVNIDAPFVLVQACSSMMGEHKNGAIVNISSIYGLVGPDMSLYKGTGMGNPAAYGASKGGLIQLTRWMACVLAPKIRVNTITIGGVFRNHKNPFLTRYKNRTPLKRMATEEDLKGAIVYLASDLSKYVTGQNLVVDGGWTAW